MEYAIPFFLQKPANILVMGDGPERGRVKIGKLGVCVQYFSKFFQHPVTSARTVPSNQIAKDMNSAL